MRDIKMKEITNEQINLGFYRAWKIINHEDNEICNGAEYNDAKEYFEYGVKFAQELLLKNFINNP